jgi:hypothetical protein
MAILPSLPGLQVAIMVNGQPLQEYEDTDYDDDSQNPREIRKYIASVSGAEFSIRLTCNKDILSHINTSFAVSVLLDGQRVLHNLIQKSDILNGAVFSSTLSKESGKWYKNKFKFCDIEISQGGMIEYLIRMSAQPNSRLQTLRDRYK